MPFQVFRRHQRKMLAVLAIMAMFAFVLADAVPNFLRSRDYANGAGRDEVVATLYGKTVRQSDLARLSSERARSNAALGQLAPYFSPETFGPTTTEAIVDAYILEHEADEVGMPATAEIAKSWIFEQARQRHGLLRMMRRDVGPFDAEAVANGLEQVYDQAFKNQLSDVAFLQGIANQIRIVKVRDLVAPPLVTPLDSFNAYEDSEVRVEARYASFQAGDFLAKVTDPPDGDATLRAFFEANRARVADPTRVEPGFTIPRRIKVEFVTLGLNAIDALKQEIRSRPLAQEIRADDSFVDDVARAFADEQEQPSPLGESPLPAFLFNDDATGTLTPPPVAFVERFVSGLVDRQVEELLAEEIDAAFEPARDACFDIVDALEEKGVQAVTGREVDGELPKLNEAIVQSSEKLRSQLGEAADQPEGIIFTRVGLTRLLADPAIARNLLRPDAFSLRWADYFTLTGIDWSSLPIRRQTLGLLESRVGLEVPTLSSTATLFPDEIFGRSLGLFEPHEYADSLGRRYLVIKTLDLPQRSPGFDAAPKAVVLNEWKLQRARERARDGAETLAKKVRDDAAGTPAEALERVAAAEGKTTTTTGQRVAVDPPTAFAPIELSDAARKAIFGLGTTGDRRAKIAPDQSGDTYYVFAMAAKRDRSLPTTAPPTDVVDYQNALNSLTFYRSTVDRESTEQNAEALMKYLRAQAGLPPDWSPPDDERGEG